jgi:integrase
MLTLSSADRESYVTAVERLRPFAIPLHAAIEEYVSAREQLNGDGLMAVVRDFNARRRQVAEKPVRAVVDELLAAKKRDGLSVRYLQTLRSHLNRFAAAFATNIGSVTAGLIDEWLARRNVGPRARNNIRRSVVTLFHFAQARDYLPKGQPTEAEYVARAKDRGGKIGVFSPKQMARLMGSAPPEHALFYALGGFSGLRRAEIERLEWKDFNFERSFIEVGKHKAKTATRRLVPIQPNLMRWLAPYRNRKGKPFKTRRDSDRAIAFAKDQGVDWPENALRHSYGTYRLAAVADAARVALEMGNSVAKLIHDYRELADERDAKAWFNITPRGAKNVVQFSASATA